MSCSSPNPASSEFVGLLPNAYVCLIKSVFRRHELLAGFQSSCWGVVTVCSGGEGYSLLVQRQDLTSAARLLHVHPTPLGHVHCGKRLQNKHKHH